MATQKVLLVEDVEDLGRSGDIAKVKAGYARNFLFPKKKALHADKNAIRIQEGLRVKRLQKAAIDRKESESIAELLNDKVYTIEVKIDQEGHMYGSVSVNDILHVIKEADGVELEKKVLQLAHAIKQTGTTTVPLRLKEDVTASVEVRVVPEGFVEEEVQEEGTQAEAEQEQEPEQAQES